MRSQARDGDGLIAEMLSSLAFKFAIVAGGVDTTTVMLGGTVHVDQRKPLVDNPGCDIPEAIAELLRLTSRVRRFRKAAGQSRTVLT